MVAGALAGMAIQTMYRAKAYVEKICAGESTFLVECDEREVR